LPLTLIETYFPLLNAHVDIAVIKILIGADVDANYKRVELIRRLAGIDTELRLEFNGKMPFEDVKTNLEHLAPFKISAVEQPLQAHMIHELYQLRNLFALDLVADESLVNLEDARQLAQSGVYTIFNIKVSKCGGLLRSKKIAALANAHGIRCQIGTHVGESPLLARAGRRLARSLPNFDCYGGGSEILFSRLFENHTRTAANQWPRMAEEHPWGIENCRDLVSRYPLLMDLGSEVNRKTPCIL
jgi:L-alanine-DL-glutamate epimerase-like enolase superfamily enzyme